MMFYQKRFNAPAIDPEIELTIEYIRVYHLSTFSSKKSNMTPLPRLRISMFSSYALILKCACCQSCYWHRHADGDGRDLKEPATRINMRLNKISDALSAQRSALSCKETESSTQSSREVQTFKLNQLSTLESIILGISSSNSISSRPVQS